MQRVLLSETVAKFWGAPVVTIALWSNLVSHLMSHVESYCATCARLGMLHASIATEVTWPKLPSGPLFVP